MAVPSENEGMEALHLLNSTEPPAWLVPSESLANATRTASQYLFSRLQSHVPKSPFDRLLVQGFDAEQIWQQLDLQSQPLLSSLRRQVKKWEKNPEELIGMFPKNVAEDVGKKKVFEDESEMKELYDDEEEEDVDMNEFDDDDEEEEEENGEEGDDEEEKESGGDEETGGKGGVEDKFLKIKDLQEFLEEDEAREYGLDRKTKKKKSDNRSSGDEEDDDEGEEEEDEDEEDELGMYGEGDDEDDPLGNARYEDFFGAKKKTTAKGRSKLNDEFEEESESGDEQDIGDINENNGEPSTHEKQLQKLQLEIERMEKENLESKHWTMQGEVTAANRPLNSAFEEVLDFERKVRPPVEITEEFTTSLEEMIKNRIIKGQFDDIERIASVPSKGSRELKELDDNKSKKGLAEVYEEEYVQKTNPAAAPSSFTDEQKEASMLFKKLCLKLDALSHFHFAPKPVIEDMSIQANAPALAMEEIAPTAVSDAAMLAPEEVFSGKGGIKDEAELTQAERKRRRANKKRKFKAETAKRMAKKPRDSTLENDNDGREEE